MTTFYEISKPTCSKSVHITKASEFYSSFLLEVHFRFLIKAWVIWESREENKATKEFHFSDSSVLFVQGARRVFYFPRFQTVTVTYFCAGMGYGIYLFLKDSIGWLVLKNQSLQSKELEKTTNSKSPLILPWYYPQLTIS